MGLGLSFANLARLQRQDMIMFRLDELGLDSDIELLIFSGETEEAMRRELVQHGLLPPSLLDAGRVRPDEPQVYKREEEEEREHE